MGMGRSALMGGITGSDLDGSYTVLRLPVRGGFSTLLLFVVAGGLQSVSKVPGQ